MNIKEDAKKYTWMQIKPILKEHGLNKNQLSYAKTLKSMYDVTIERLIEMSKGYQELTFN